MNGMHTPLILIEVVLVFGGALLFGWWQLRSVARDQQRAREEKARAEAAEAAKTAEMPDAPAADEPRT
jgi:hypothetical protein